MEFCWPSTSALSVPSEIGQFIVLGEDILGAEILYQGVVFCLQLQFIGPLNQLLKIMKEHRNPEGHRDVAILLLVIRFGQHTRHDAAATYPD